jgi:hypothetical protein
LVEKPLVLLRIEEDAKLVIYISVVIDATFQDMQFFPSINFRNCCVALKKGKACRMGARTE